MSNGENTGTTISTQIITASLAMISLIGAFAVFIIDKREVNWWYYILTGISFLCFVVSIFLGGKGISGKGKNKVPNPFYDWQAKTALIGVILFGISVFLPRQKTDELEKKINEEHENIIRLKLLDSLKTKELENRIDSLENKVHKLQ